MVEPDDQCHETDLDWATLLPLRLRLLLRGWHREHGNHQQHEISRVKQERLQSLADDYLALEYYLY